MPSYADLDQFTIKNPKLFFLTLLVGTGLLIYQLIQSNNI